MTIYDIEEVLTDHFKTLNYFAGVQFITSKNVWYPNKPIKVPEDKRWFEVTFLNNEADSSAMFDESQDRYTGFMQIDICVPLDKGELEASNKVKWLSKLFRRGQFLGDISVEITSTSRVGTVTESDHYRVIMRVNYSCDIDIE